MNFPQRRDAWAPVFTIAGAGLLSGLFYSSYLVSFAFLIPVQYSYTRQDWKAGLFASGLSLAIIALGQLQWAAQFDLSYALLCLGGLVPPAALLTALAFVNMRKGRLSTGYRLLVASIALALLAMPFLVKAFRDAAFLRWLQDALASIMSASGLSTEDSASYAIMALSQVKALVSSSLAPLVLSLLGISWWLGSRIALKTTRLATTGSVLRDAPHESNLAQLRIPSCFLWPSLISWAMLLAALLFAVEGLPRALLWNAALVFAVSYAVQGIGIIVFFATTRWNVPRALGAGFAMLVLAGFFVPTLGALLAVVLPLLGITEVWIPYRRNKGAYT